MYQGIAPTQHSGCDSLIFGKPLIERKNYETFYLCHIIFCFTYTLVCIAVRLRENNGSG